MTKRLLMMTVVAFSSVLWSSAYAQLPPGAGSGSRKDKSIEDKYRSDEMERVRREAVRPADRPASKFPQIKEDFERIQVINSDVIQANALNAGLDYGRISGASAEIRKRATRLKSNLFASASKERTKQIEQVTKGRQDLKSLLTELDKAITSFVHNPMFEETRIVSPQDSIKAEEDLEEIIRLSARTSKKVR